MVCWDPRIEEMPKEELQRMQYKLLKSLVYRLYSFSPFYHDRMKEQKVHPDDIKELADVKKLPFMFKRDLRDGYPDKILPHRRTSWSGTMSRRGPPGNRPW
jgi:phenylacetate-CoA ligase